ncbi:MAG: YbhB/YbcL family Raf kinase inhibitor-like protein [candidate division WOR-3 bacterium]
MLTIRILILSVLFIACSKSTQPLTPSGISVSSNSFTNGGQIPVKYTCDGQDISVHIKWSNYPQETKSFVLIMSDPDAPGSTFYHWILYDIPANINEIQEGQSVGVKGRNDFGNLGYNGPCPPSVDPAHRYYITIYALNVQSLALNQGANANQVLQAMEGKIITKGQIYGTYKR